MFLWLRIGLDPPLNIEKPAALLLLLLLLLLLVGSSGVGDGDFCRTVRRTRFIILTTGGEIESCYCKIIHTPLGVDI